MRSKQISILTLCLILVLMVFVMVPGCAKPAPTPTPTTSKPTTAAFQWPESLTIWATSVGSSANAYMSALAPILEKSTGMKTRVTFDSNETARLVKALRYHDINTHTLKETVFYYHGQFGSEIFEKLQSRVLWSLYSSPVALYVKADSPIKTIQDLKTMKVKVATAPSVPSTRGTMENSLPAFLGMTPAQAKSQWEYVPLGDFNAFSKAVIDGKADISLVVCASSLAFEIEAAQGGIRIIDLPLEDKAGWDRFLAVEGCTLPGKINFGIKTAQGHTGYMDPKDAIVAADFDEELAYQLAKWLHQNYDSYKDAFATLAMSNVDQFRAYLNSTPIPVHPGTIKYLKEIGKWTAADDTWNAQAVEIMNAFVKAGDAAWAEAKTAGVEVKIDNQKWLDIWNKHTSSLTKFKIRL